MRRRDAIDNPLHFKRCTGPPALVSVVLSLGAHAILLAAASVAVLPEFRSPELIRVSLAAAGGAGAGPASQPAPAPSEPLAPPQPARRLEPKRASPPRARRQTRHAARIAAAEQLAMMPSQGNAWGTGASIGGEARTGAGSGNGHGTGPGSGDGADQRPACVYCPQPRYPFIARVRGWQGSVDVGLLVRADGTVDAASLRRSSGYGVLDEAAMAVARRSRFSPPVAQGLPAPLRGRIEYRFELTAPR